MNTRKFRSLLQSAKFRKLLKNNKVRKIAIFGSYARGEQKPGSDIDFLAEFDPDADLLDQVGLKQDLEKFFGKAIDVITPGSINKYLRNRISREAVYL